jgi:hypothetical protein
MAARKTFIERKINDEIIHQNQNNGYINATQISKIHRVLTGERREPNDWLRTDTAQRAINKLSSFTGISLEELVLIKQGGKYQGTWIHPRLSVRYAMWVNEDFSLQVEDWVHEWISSVNNPIRLEADIDRVGLRDDVKDNKRLALTDQVKFFLESLGQYNPGSKKTSDFFARVHDELNLVLTSETAGDMRIRLERKLGKSVKSNELLRDYFPIVDLSNYAAVCQAAANNIEQGMHPINAIRLAAKQVLSPRYVPAPIDFAEQIKLVRFRIERAGQLDLRGLLE